MNVVVSDDWREYDAAAAAFLERDPVRNTVALTVLDMVRRGGGYGDQPPWFAWALDGAGVVIGAVFRTPPYFVGLASMPAAAARALGAACRLRALPGAIGPEPLVAEFAAGAGRAFDVHMAEVQYVLETLVPPAGVRGEPRAFTEADSDRYEEWMAAFFTETGLLVQADPRGSLRRRLEGGGSLTFWYVDDEPVALASRSPAMVGVPRIGPVWTQPEHRGRGYAAAVTAVECAQAFAAGATACTLFADAANPTSNRVYERLGFRPVGHVVEATFGPG